MKYLNIIFGLGGAGRDIVHDFLKIKKRYPIGETNDVDWFIIDTVNPNEQFDFRDLDDNIDDKLIQLEPFNDANLAVKTIKELNPESNIEDIFPVDGKIREYSEGNYPRTWGERKLGYLSLLYHLVAARKNVINKLDNLLARKKNFRKINFFFVSSIAGSTGSGILLPLNVLVKNFMDDKYQQYSVAYYHLLATPEAVAQGSRDPAVEVIVAYLKANAYQTLKEIDIISKLKSEDDFNWEVQITNDKKIEYNRSMGNLVDNVFLFHNYNTSNYNLSFSTNPADRYKPGFHLMAWSLYILNSMNVPMFKDIGYLLNDFPQKPFIGMGAYILEYPQNDILRKCAHILLKNINENLANFRKISEEDICNRIENFHLPVEKFEKSADSPKKYEENLKRYTRQINHYTNKSQKSALIKLEPKINLPDTNKYALDFRKKLNESVDNMLKTDMFTLLDLKVYLIWLEDKILERKITLERNIKREEGFLKNLNEQLNSSLSIKDIKKLKTGNCFKSKYNLKLYENTIELVDENKNYISRFINHLKKIHEVFEYCEYCNEQDPYFKYLPLKRTYEDLDDISSKIIQKLSDDYKKEHLETNNIELGKDELKQKILKDLWISFSIKYTEYFVNLIFNNVEKDEETIDNENLIKKYEEYLIEYLRKKGNLREWNNIVEIINQGSLKSKKFNLKMAEPYINIPDFLDVDNEKFIACSSNNRDRIDTSNLEDFKDADIYEIIPHDNIVVFCEIAGKFSLEQLNIENYKKEYESKIKNDKTKWYRYIDPCFEEIEDK